jgi:hypothetical protein
MIYIEELQPGDVFIYNNIIYLLTVDFNTKLYKLCFNLKDGSPRWMKPSDMVEKINLYTLDKDNNIISIKNQSYTR